MIDKHIFVDSNIIIYSYDSQADEKHKIAKERLTGLWSQKIPPSVSIQVLQECYVNLLRKNVSLGISKKIIQCYLNWNVIDNDSDLLIRGIEIKERWKISFWDAMIIAAAQKAKADIIWSEDLNSNQNYEGVRVVNPFKE